MSSNTAAPRSGPFTLLDLRTPSDSRVLAKHDMNYTYIRTVPALSLLL